MYSNCASLAENSCYQSSISTNCPKSCGLCPGQIMEVVESDGWCSSVVTIYNWPLNMFRSCQLQLTFLKCSGSTPVASNTCYNLYSNCADLCRFNQHCAINRWWLLAVIDIYQEPKLCPRILLNDRYWKSNKLNGVFQLFCWWQVQEGMRQVLKKTLFHFLTQWRREYGKKKTCGNTKRQPRTSFEYNHVLYIEIVAIEHMH